MRRDIVTNKVKNYFSYNETFPVSIKWLLLMVQIKTFLVFQLTLGTSERVTIKVVLVYIMGQGAVRVELMCLQE